MSADPRVALGYEVEPNVTGPYNVQPARRDGSGDDGGSLDVGITARTTGGKRVVIGEIWAACPDEDGVKTRIDANAVARTVVTRLNAAEGAD